MPFELEIAEQSLRFLNEPAKTEFRAAVQRYSVALLDEASRLEAASKSTAGNPEITSTMIKDADILLRRGYTRPHKSKLVRFAQITATAGSFFAGLLADMEKLKHPSALITFLVIITVTITATVFAALKD